ncbi:MAG: hypothetical protein U7123_03245 [Potamolinea sp.]
MQTTLLVCITTEDLIPDKDGYATQWFASAFTFSRTGSRRLIVRSRSALVKPSH